MAVDVEQFGNVEKLNSISEFDPAERFRDEMGSGPIDKSTGLPESSLRLVGNGILPKPPIPTILDIPPILNDQGSLNPKFNSILDKGDIDLRDSSTKNHDSLEELATDRVLRDMPEAERKETEQLIATWKMQKEEYDKAYFRALMGTGGLGFPEKPVKPAALVVFEGRVQHSKGAIFELINKK